MITVKGLSKTFDGIVALDRVDLHVPKGCVYGLVGPNGAGKSTLIQHLTGAYRQDSGEALIDGQPVFENNGVKARIGCVSSEFYYPAGASIDSMARLYAGLYPSFDNETYESLRTAFNLDPAKPIRTFSKGMKKQAAFWLVLSLRPDVLLLDEPLDGLDPLMRRQVWSLVLSGVSDAGMTVLVSSHNLRELEGVCDHLGVMDRGRMLHEFDLEAIDQEMVKVQVALPDGAELPEGLDVLHAKSYGRLQELVVRGNASEVSARLEEANPVLLEVLPLSLEELFLFEMGGAGHDVAQLLY